MDRMAELVAELERYRPARQRLLHVLGLMASNREPLAEFAEHLVAALTGGILAPSRVQSNWDIELPDGQLMQVRFLANALGPWINEHTVCRILGVHWYVLVLYEDMRVVGVLAFPNDLTRICALLGKRHPRQDETLQLTMRNWRTIRDNAHEFVQLGMKVWLPPFQRAIS